MSYLVKIVLCSILLFSFLISCESKSDKIEKILLDRRMWVVDSIRANSSLVFSSDKNINELLINENTITLHKSGVINLPPTKNNLFNNATWQLTDFSDKTLLEIENSEIESFNQNFKVNIDHKDGLYYLRLMSSECSIFGRAPSVY